MDQTGLRRSISDLLNAQRLAVLSTISTDGASPYCSLVNFAATDDLKHLLFVTARNTSKYMNIRSRPAVSLLIDSRMNSPEDLSGAVALTIIGKAAEPDRDEQTPFNSVYMRKHPELREFLNAPDSSLLCVHVEKYIFVSRFSNVAELMI